MTEWAERFERDKELCRVWFQSGLTEEDRDWLRPHLELAGQTVPTLDISWITTTDYRGTRFWERLRADRADA